MARNVPTRSGKATWDRSTIWAMLRNPAYKGTACFGKTEQVERKKITRPLRQRGGFSPRSSASRERPKEGWLEISVPSLVSQDTFSLAQERLAVNKQFSRRHTIEPTLLQGLLVCSVCGYAMYRTATRTSARKLYYYRCTGSDRFRHANGPICTNRPIRQDYLDDLVWQQVAQLFENPDLIHKEINRRIQEARNSNPTKTRKEILVKESNRVQNGIDRLLNAYQEGLLELTELRTRIHDLRKKELSIKTELQALDAKMIDQEIYLQLVHNIDDFLARIRKSAESLDVLERQKILRLIAKEILVGPDTVTIKHSIQPPISPSPPLTSNRSPVSSNNASYLLCGRSNYRPLRRAYFRSRPLAIFRYSGPEPLLDQAEHLRVCDATFQELHQPRMVDRVVARAGLECCPLVPVPPRRTRRADFPQRAPQVALVG